MLETLQKLTQFAVGLSIPSKVILSAVLVLITVFVLSILWNSPLEREKSGSPSDSNSGNSANVTIQGQDIRVRDVIIHQGDSPQVKQQKIAQAKRLIAHTILSDISAIDARLGYVKEAVRPDNFEEELREARKAVAPSMEEAAAAGYRRLIASVNVSSLRQDFNSSPLSAEVSQPVVQMLIDAGIEAKPILYFHHQIKEVEWAAESLFSALSASTKNQEGAESESIWSNYYAQRINLAIQTYRLRSDIAYLAGLKALRELNDEQSNTSAELVSLKHLGIHDLSNPDSIERSLERDLSEMKELVSQKKAADDTGQQLLRKKTEEFKQLNDQLKINQTDTWSEVVGKAISLREFGRIPDAMMAFQQYERMFSSIDPGAKYYVDTAKAFTQQMKLLKVRGGIYLYQILDRGAAQEASLKVGDIIIEYDGKPIAQMDSLLAGLNESHEGKANRITYLRFHPETGRFTRHIGVIKGGPFGAGFMPI